MPIVGPSALVRQGVVGMPARVTEKLFQVVPVVAVVVVVVVVAVVVVVVVVVVPVGSVVGVRLPARGVVGVWGRRQSVRRAVGVATARMSTPMEVAVCWPPW